jgi:hypothetical protein
MPKMTGAVAVSKAGAKVQRAQKRVNEAEKALERARHSKARAESEYFDLLREALPSHVQRATGQPREVPEQTAA